MATKNLLATDVSAWTRSLGAATAYTADTTDWSGENCDKFATTGRSKSDANYLEISGTWETLFGVPAGATVSLIGTPDAFDYQCLTYTTGAASTAGPLELRDSAGTTLLLTLAAGAAYSGTVARTTKAGTQQAIPSAQQPSNSSIRIRLRSQQATGNSSSANNTLLLGHVNITVTYAFVDALTAGSFSLAGQGLTLAGAPSLAAGSFSEAGQGLTAPLVEAIGTAGSFSLAGQGSPTQPLTALGATGSYSAAGQGLGAALAEDTGAAGLFTLAGEPSPSQALADAGGTGSFAIAGQGLTAPLVEAGGAAGSFAAAGQALTVALVEAPGAAGSFSEAGQDLVLAGAGLQAAGSFALAGEPLSGLALAEPVGAGSFALVGESITEDLGGGGPPTDFSDDLAAGSFALAGQAATAALASAEQPGAATLAGQSAGAALAEPLSAGAFTIAGEGLIEGGDRVDQLAAGIFSESGIDLDAVLASLLDDGVLTAAGVDAEAALDDLLGTGRFAVVGEPIYSPHPWSWRDPEPPPGSVATVWSHEDPEPPPGSSHQWTWPL